MTAFELYLRLGIGHITDFQGLDHIAFLIALSATYSGKDWRKLLIVITLFTIGHAITLLLATLNLVALDGNWVELLIALTIFVTALFNLSKSGQSNQGKAKFWLAGIFGLIHGLGFSRFYNMIAEGGNKWLNLASFTLGIELGQLIIVMAFMILAWLLVNAFTVSKRDWVLILSGSVLGISLVMILNRLPAVF